VRVTRSRAPRSTLALLERVVLDVLVDNEPTTRAEIVARTKLSRAVVAGLVTSLVDRGALVAVTDRAEPARRGRPSLAYRKVSDTAPVALLRLRHHQQTTLSSIAGAGEATESQPLPRWSASWDEFADALAAAFERMESALGTKVRHVVIAAPFPVVDGQGAPIPHSVALPDSMALIVPSVPDWLACDPRPAVSSLLGRPTLMINDANLAALGEASYGAGRNRAHVLHLMVRDGIGAGLVFDGAIVSGSRGMAGELAHAQVVDDGPFCVCGNRGCLATQSLDPLVLTALTGRYARPLTFDDVEQLVRHGDAVAVRFFTDYGVLVGRPLATIVTTLDPDVVVVDSELGEAGRPFMAGIRAALAARCTPHLAAHLDIRQGTLHDPVAWGALAASSTAALS
jgi:predicted NBD/HSP70 family sugar kinase